jgi:hypothetical protein
MLTPSGATKNNIIEKDEAAGKEADVAGRAGVISTNAPLTKSHG